MTDKIRRRQIRIEMHEVIIIRKRQWNATGFCTECQAMVDAFSPDEIAILLRETPENVTELLQNGDVHAVDKQSGEARLICGNSLKKRIN